MIVVFTSGHNTWLDNNIHDVLIISHLCLMRLQQSGHSGSHVLHCCDLVIYKRKWIRSLFVKVMCSFRRVATTSPNAYSLSIGPLEPIYCKVIKTAFKLRLKMCRNVNSDITVPAYTLAPGYVRPSADTILITTCYIYSSRFLQLWWFLITFWWLNDVIQNVCNQVEKSHGTLNINLVLRHRTSLETIQEISNFRLAI